MIPKFGILNVKRELTVGSSSVTGEVVAIASLTYGRDYTWYVAI